MPNYGMYILIRHYLLYQWKFCGQTARVRWPLTCVAKVHIIDLQWVESTVLITRYMQTCLTQENGFLANHRGYRWNGRWITTKIASEVRVLVESCIALHCICVSSESAIHSLCHFFLIVAGEWFARGRMVRKAWWTTPPHAFIEERDGNLLWRAHIGIVEKVQETSSDTGIHTNMRIASTALHITVDVPWNAETHPHHTV